MLGDRLLKRGKFREIAFQYAAQGRKMRAVRNTGQIAQEQLMETVAVVRP